MAHKAINASQQLICLLIIFVLFSATAHAAADLPQRSAKKAYIFGILPAFSTGHLIRLFGPIAQRLSTELNRPVLIETAPDFKTFLHRSINEKRYDILLTPSHFYPITQKKAGYKAIARDDTRPMQAIIVVEKNSPIKTLDDLRGKSLSIIDPFALAAVVTKGHLLQADIDDITFTRVPSHTASLAMIGRDSIDAVSLMDTAYYMSTEKIRANSRIIFHSEKIQTIPFAVAPWLSEYEKRLIQDTLTSPENIHLFKPLTWTKMVTPKPRDYEELEWLIPLMGKR